VQLFLAFVVALTVTAALIPVLVHWAPTIGLTDAPGPRKVHSIPVPRVGGLAMAVGLLLPTLITVQLTPSIRGLLLGLVVLLIFGLWDDRVNLGYRTKFAGDSGSQMLGFSVGALALLATQGEASPLSAALPLLLLGIPIMDTLTVMLTRIRAGRSPFSADSNHLHHRLLALGFAHREAVFLIYLLQVALVLLAYFLRFESDSEVFIAFCVFAAVVLGLLRRANQVGWRLKYLGESGGIRRYINGFTPAARIPTLALGVMTTCLVLYATTVLASSRHVGADLGLMCLGMLIVLLLLTSWKAQRSLQWFERTATYISVVLLVYLDQTIPNKPPLLTTLSWTCVGITGAAALVRFWLSPTRRFELTTLDLIVLFIALVLPNLPGSIALPADLPGGIAKAVILLYVVEMLLTIDLKHLMPRMFLALTLAVIAGRALFSLSA